MANLIDAYAKGGQALTLQEAYDIAVTRNPEIKAILDKRESDAAILGQQQNLQGKKNASSSIIGNKGGEGGAMGGGTLRDTINDAWDSQESTL